MTNAHYLFLEPVDVLFLRTNKSFGDPGSYGESMVPPWPSVVAGAIRSRILADSGIDLRGFAQDQESHPELGTPSQPGSFRLVALQLAMRRADGSIEPLYPVPADLAVERSQDGHLCAFYSRPVRLMDGLRSSYLLPLHPVLAQAERSKPVGGLWLTASGWRKYLAGEALDTADFVSGATLWDKDPRIGIGLSPITRSVEEGRLFTAEAVAFRQSIHGRNGPAAGLLTAVSGATPPSRGLVRLGGDGRAAVIHAVQSFSAPEPDWAAIAKSSRCRLVLATPGIFEGGWRPNGVTRNKDEFRFDLHGVRGVLVAAAVARAEVVSGWDLAREQPKPARRVVPAGSVYWLDNLETDEQSLRNLLERGLWPEPCTDPPRRAEGFNQIWIAPWTGDQQGE
jgi:CRISPR-associated protein Cmr3